LYTKGNIPLDCSFSEMSKTSRTAIIVDKQSAEDEVLLLLERLQEIVCETNDSGPHQKHPGKTNRLFFV
jgi:hypothetical protein